MRPTPWATNAVAEARKGSRSGPGPNVRHPDTRRSYMLRSFVVCTLCGNRMLGKTCRRKPYYVCEPAKNLGPKAKRLLPDHPPSIYIREEALVEGVLGFLAERVFGPRREFLSKISRR